ncbi:MAG: hypothetical protein LQ349_009559 [Xanthoria aureola]|nr:MAG: hypothetical protein LQ349_009559 [Xanthoria aureola]
MTISIRPGKHHESFLQDKTAATGGILPSPTFGAVVGSLISTGKDVWPPVIFSNHPGARLKKANGIFRLARLVTRVQYLLASWMPSLAALGQRIPPVSVKTSLLHLHPNHFHYLQGSAPSSEVLSRRGSNWPMICISLARYARRIDAHASSQIARGWTTLGFLSFICCHGGRGSAGFDAFPSPWVD